MAITCGFFNSLDGDRKYDARQMGEIFDGLIMDGVFMSIGDALKTTPSSGMTVAVGTGRAWFLHTWTKNDSEYLIEVSAAESVLNRIDTIVLDVDNTEAVRNNTIKLIKGTPASNAKRPNLINITDHKQIPLADILVPAGATTLATTNITNIVGTSECPYVTGPLSIIQNDDILAAWQEEFDTWFEGVKGSLDGDTAGNLYNLIQQKVDKTSVLDTMDEVNLTTEKGFVAGALAIKELNSNNIVESGHNDNGYWRKYGDGTLEMWNDTYIGSIDITTPDNWNYYGGGQHTIQLPMSSLSYVYLTVTARGACAPWASVSDNGLGKDVFKAWIYASSSSPSSRIWLSWHAFGTWK